MLRTNRDGVDPQLDLHFTKVTQVLDLHFILDLLWNGDLRTLQHTQIHLIQEHHSGHTEPLIQAHPSITGLPFFLSWLIQGKKVI